MTPTASAARTRGSARPSRPRVARPELYQQTFAQRHRRGLKFFWVCFCGVMIFMAGAGTAFFVFMTQMGGMSGSGEMPSGSSSTSQYGSTSGMYGSSGSYGYSSSGSSG